MIDIKELRVGNWIATDSMSHRVVEIRKDAVIIDRVPMNNLRRADEGREFRQLNTGSIAHELDELFPIPITNELLEKCGFRFVEIPARVDDEGDILIPYEHWELKDTNWCISGDAAGDLYHGNMDIKHLHQLQNLYFALTGKELEVNL